MWVWNAIERDLVAYWQKGIKAFRNASGQAFLLCLILYVARGDVYAQDITLNVVEKLGIICSKSLQRC